MQDREYAGYPGLVFMKTTLCKNNPAKMKE
jgi:hypothetical protein